MSRLPSSRLGSGGGIDIGSLPNALSILRKLQADRFAGVWAYSTSDEGLLESGDVQEGTNAAAVGDDRIQQKSTGRDQPRIVDPRLLRARHPS